MPDVRSKPGAVPPSVHDIPAPDRRTVPRPRLLAQLDAATRATRLVVVAAEAGSGKTSLVSSWLHQVGARSEVCWRDLSSVSYPVEVLDALPTEAADLRSADRALRVVGRGRASTARAGSVANPSRSIIVLDDFPDQPAEPVAAALDRLVHRIGHHVGLVLLCSGSPVLDLQQLGVAGESRDVASIDLALNEMEVAAVLSRESVDPTPTVVSELLDLTHGWAWGVRRGASLLARTTSVTGALRETELAIADYLQHSILRDVPDASLELITATSMVAEVSPDIAIAVIGDERGLTAATAARTRGFVRLQADGSFTVHPLLRRHLQKQLRRRPASARLALRRASECTAQRGDLGAAISMAVDGGDWSWAAEALIESLAVPRLLVSADDPLLDTAGVVDQLGSAQPMLAAAAALNRSWPETAARAMAEAKAPRTGRDPRSPAARLSEELIGMALARWEGDPGPGLAHQQQAMVLLAQLSLAQRVAAPELLPLLQSHAAAFEVMNGAADRARVALERGAQGFAAKPVPNGTAASVAAAACAGQLAWQEAVAGELTSALRHASDVLTARPADGHETGVVYAQLATIWTHISRDELDQARQRFQSVDRRHASPEDGAMLPELAVATALTAARLAAAVGLDGVGQGVDRFCRTSPGARQYELQLRLIRAELELDAGLPAKAVQLLDVATEPGAEVHALRARAWIQLADLPSVGETLRLRPAEAVALLPRLQLDLAEAWLARARGDLLRQRSLVDRVLRTAGREQLRAPIAWAKAWLLEVVGSDPVLLQRHGAFLASVRNITLGRQRSRPVAPPVSGLTVREIDILQRLGALSTNDEIAADLFLSPNTVKTHLKSLYRKLEVTRRSDAYRRGRALGLC